MKTKPFRRFMIRWFNGPLHYRFVKANCKVSRPKLATLALVSFFTAVVGTWIYDVSGQDWGWWIMIVGLVGFTLLVPIFFYFVVYPVRLMEWWTINGAQYKEYSIVKTSSGKWSLRYESLRDDTGPIVLDIFNTEYEAVYYAYFEIYGSWPYH